jgi:hypothetical protein
MPTMPLRNSIESIRKFRSILKDHLALTIRGRPYSTTKGKLEACLFMSLIWLHLTVGITVGALRNL